MTHVLLIDDHEVVRIGLKQLATQSFPDTMWAETDTAQEALKLISEKNWDLVVLELSLNGNRGLELLKEIKTAQAKAPVLVLTSHAERQYALRAMKAGAAGYINKTSPAAEISRAMKRVCQGGRYVSTSLAESLTADLHRKGPEAIHDLLSDREFQVLRLIGAGKTVGEIAVMLSISDKTVSTYRARILDKTGLKNNAEVVRYVVEHGLVD